MVAVEIRHVFLRGARLFLGVDRIQNANQDSNVRTDIVLNQAAQITRTAKIIKYAIGTISAKI